MQICFLSNIKLDIITSFDDDKIVSYTQDFAIGTTIEVDILADEEDHIDIKFRDGSVSYGILKSWCEITE